MWFILPDYYLGKQQNAVTNTPPDGQPVDNPVHNEGKDSSSGFWNRFKSACHRKM